MMLEILSSLQIFQAQAGDSSASLIMMLGMVGAVILVFYFLIIRPQNKKQKQLQNMLNSLKKGDKVLTIGGINGVVTAVKDKFVTVKVDDNTKVEFTKNAISQIVDKKENDSEEVKK